MASFESSIPPRTHCSAATSCGGARSKWSFLGAISVTLPCLLPPPWSPCRHERCRHERCRHGRGTNAALPPPDTVVADALTFCGRMPPSTTGPVDGCVDKVCRHADHVVRSLGKYLWKWWTRISPHAI